MIACMRESNIVSMEVASFGTSFFESKEDHFRQRLQHFKLNEQLRLHKQRDKVVKHFRAGALI